MGAFVNLSGRTLGLWTVLRLDGRSNGATFWACRCACGTERVVRAGHLVKGSSTCCGCNREPVKHGAAVGSGKNFPGAYKTWRAMRARCTNQNHQDYPRYGGTGVTICARWSDFANFLVDMGERPAGKSIDRFPNPRGNYEPENCRWATQAEQVAQLPQNQRGYRHKQKSPSQSGVSV